MLFDPSCFVYSVTTAQSNAAFTSHGNYCNYQSDNWESVLSCLWTQKWFKPTSPKWIHMLIMTAIYFKIIEIHFLQQHS